MVSSQKVGDENWGILGKILRSPQTGQTNVSLSTHLCLQKYLSEINFSSLYFQILQRQLNSVTLLLGFDFFLLTYKNKYNKVNNPCNNV